MAKSAQDMKMYNVPIDYFVQKMRAINGAGLNVTLKSENPAPDGVWFRVHHGMTMMSYGEKITVTLTNVQGGTQVHIHSECGMPTQIVDYGKNASNVRAFFQYLERDLVPVGAPAAQPMPAGQPMPAAQPAPAGQPMPAAQPAARFCPACGKPAPQGARFCTNCGTRLG